MVEPVVAIADQRMGRALALVPGHDLARRAHQRVVGAHGHGPAVTIVAAHARRVDAQSRRPGTRRAHVGVHAWRRRHHAAGHLRGLALRREQRAAARAQQDAVAVHGDRTREQQADLAVGRLEPRLLGPAAGATPEYVGRAAALDAAGGVPWRADHDGVAMDRQRDAEVVLGLGILGDQSRGEGPRGSRALVYVDHAQQRGLAADGQDVGGHGRALAAPGEAHADRRVQPRGFGPARALARVEVGHPGAIAGNRRRDQRGIARQRHRAAEGVLGRAVGRDQLGLLGPAAGAAGVHVGRAPERHVVDRLVGRPDQHGVARDRDREPEEIAVSGIAGHELGLDHPSAGLAHEHIGRAMEPVRAETVPGHAHDGAVAVDRDRGAEGVAAGAVGTQAFRAAIVEAAQGLEGHVRRIRRGPRSQGKRPRQHQAGGESGLGDGGQECIREARHGIQLIGNRS